MSASLGAVLGNNRGNIFGGSPRKPRKRKLNSPKKQRPKQERSFPFSSNFNPNLMMLLRSENYGPRQRSNSFEPNINYNLERQGNYARLPSTRQTRKARPITDREIQRGIKQTVQTGKDIYQGSKTAVQSGRQAYQGGKKVYHSVKDRINRVRGREEGFRVSIAQSKGGMEFTETFRKRRDAEAYAEKARKARTEIAPKGYTKSDIEDL